MCRAATITAWLVFALGAGVLAAQAPPVKTALDAQVTRFLEGHRDSWRDMNVPEADAQVLHDLIVERRYRRVLDVGTSTGRSAIWMAWAVSRTGGRLVTIEIDDSRHRQALANITEAGLARFADARLGDAHAVIPRLPGEFDLVFLDAEKDGFVRYAKAVWPRLSHGGALAAHNVERATWPGSDVPVVVREREFYEFVTRLPGAKTEFRAGVFVAFKK